MDPIPSIAVSSLSYVHVLITISSNRPTQRDVVILISTNWSIYFPMEGLIFIFLCLKNTPTGESPTIHHSACDGNQGGGTNEKWGKFVQGFHLRHCRCWFFAFRRLLDLGFRSKWPVVDSEKAADSFSEFPCLSWIICVLRAGQKQCWARHRFFSNKKVRVKRNMQM